MGITEQIAEMGLTVRIKEGNNLGVSPWSKVSPDVREWLSKHKQEILDILAANGDKSSQEPPREPVGDIVASLIPAWAVKDAEGCECRSVQAKMNTWGAAGCESNMEFLVEHFMGQQERLLPILQKFPDWAKSRTIRAMLQYAIRKARKA